MPVSYRILQRLNLVHVTYAGQISLLQSQQQKVACVQEPAFRPWMWHLVDMTAMTGYQRDFIGQMALQAQTVDLFPETHDLKIVFLAPSPLAQELAHIARRSWEGLGHVTVMITEEEEIALSLLGLTARRLADLDAEVS